VKNRDGSAHSLCLWFSRRIRRCPGLGKHGPLRRERGRHSASLGDSASRMEPGRYPDLLERLLELSRTYIFRIQRTVRAMTAFLSGTERAIRTGKAWANSTFRTWKSEC